MRGEPFRWWLLPLIPFLFLIALVFHITAFFDEWKTQRALRRMYRTHHLGVPRD